MGHFVIMEARCQGECIDSFQRVFFGKSYTLVDADVSVVQDCRVVYRILHIQESSVGFW